jgi:hypothetical protein
VTLLTTTVEDEPLQLITVFKMAKKMWEKMSAYEQKSEQRLEHLYLQLLVYKQHPVNSVAAHVSKLPKLRLELNEESWRVDKCRLPVTLLIMRILSTLPGDYFEFRTTWESVPREERSVEYLLERLSMVEMRLSKKLSDADSVTSVALVAKGYGNASKQADGVKKKSSNKKQAETVKPQKDYSRIKCYICKQVGHTQYKCPEKNSESRQQQTRSLAFFSEVLFTEAAEDGDTWVPDTGATHHMTMSADNFVSYIAFDEPKQITLGNQKLMLAYGRGDVMIEALVGNKWFKHCLKDVWYTPDVIKNLFSVPTAADKGFEYWLNKDSCRITQNGEPVIIGNRHHLLYKKNCR